MSKVHVNDNGEVQKCGATKGKCPFLNRDEVRHFDTEEQAYNFVAEKFGHGQKSLKKPGFSLSEVTPLLSESMDVELLNDMIKRDYILRNRHALDDSLQVLCYSRFTQFEGKWNDATKLARGLIIQSSGDRFDDAVIVQRPWKKFYTLEQVETGWALGDEEDGASTSGNDELALLDFDAPAEVTDKMDGSLGVLYMSPDGVPALSTKGSFESDQAEFYTNMLRKDDKFLQASSTLMKKHPDTTFTFELISSGEHQIVLDYEENDISLIGAIQKSNGVYYSVNDYTNIWSPDNGLNTTETMAANNLREAFELPDRPNREGVVVRIISDDPEKQMQIKIKQDDYKALHKLRTQFSKKDAREVIRNMKDVTYADLLNLADNEDVTQFSQISETVEDISNLQSIGANASKFREERLQYYRDMLIPRAKEIKRAKEYIDSLPDDYFVGDEREAKKRFAAFVNSSNNDNGIEKGLMHSLFQTRFNGEDLSSRSAGGEMRRIASKS